MYSLKIRSKSMLFICVSLLFYIVSLWECLEFWVVPKAIQKLGQDRAYKVSENVNDNYIKLYFENPNEILQANKNGIDLYPLSEYLEEVKIYNNHYPKKQIILWNIIAKFLWILLVIVVAIIIFWFFVARQSQNLEEQQPKQKRSLSIKQDLQQLKQETNIQKKAERVIQIIERHEFQQLINKKK